MGGEEKFLPSSPSPFITSHLLFGLPRNPRGLKKGEVSPSALPMRAPPSRLRSVLSYLHHLLNFPFHSFSSIPPRKEGEEGTSQTWRRGGGRGDEDVGVLLLAKALLMLYGYGDSFSGRGEHIRQCPGDGGESL